MDLSFFLDIEIQVNINTWLFFAVCEKNFQVKEVNFDYKSPMSLRNMSFQVCVRFGIR